MRHSDRLWRTVLENFGHRKNNLLRLLNLNEEQQLQDKEFQKYVEQSNTYIEAWKAYYGLPATDPRWTEATEEDIFEDMLKIRVEHYKQSNVTGNTEFDEWNKKRKLDKQFEKNWKERAEKLLNEQLSL